MLIFLSPMFAMLTSNTILTVDVMEKIILESHWFGNPQLLPDDYLNSLKDGPTFLQSIAHQLAAQLDRIVKERTLTELRLYLAKNRAQERLTHMNSDPDTWEMLQLVENEQQSMNSWDIAEVFELYRMARVPVEDLLKEVTKLLPRELVIDLANISEGYTHDTLEKSFCSQPSTQNELGTSRSSDHVKRVRSSRQKSLINDFRTEVHSVMSGTLENTIPGTQSSSSSERQNTKSFVIQQQTAPRMFTKKIQRYAHQSHDSVTGVKNNAPSDWSPRFKEKEVYAKPTVDMTDGVVTRLKINIKNNILPPEKKLLVNVQEEPLHDGCNHHNQLDDDANKKGSDLQPGIAKLVKMFGAEDSIPSPDNEIKKIEVSKLIELWEKKSVDESNL